MRTQASNRESEVIFNTVGRTCDRLGLGRTSIYELLKTNELEAVKFGSATRITEASIQKLVEKRLAAARGSV